MPKNDNEMNGEQKWLKGGHGVIARAKKTMADYLWGKEEKVNEPHEKRAWKTRAEQASEGKFSWGQYD